MVNRILLSIVISICTYSVFATNYYVKPEGNDNLSGTSLEEAFATIQKAADLTLPGDTVFLANGTYRQKVDVKKSGNRCEWIIYKSINKHGAKIFSDTTDSVYGSCLSIKANYIVIDGFDLTSNYYYGSGVKADKGTHHIIARNNYAHDCAESGITMIDGDYRYIIGNITARNSERMYWAGSGISLYGLVPFDDKPGYHNVVKGNISYENFNGPNTAQTDGNGIIIDDFRNTQKFHAEDAPKDIFYTGMETLIEGNICYNNGGAGIQVYLSNNVTVRNNTCYMNQLRRTDETWRGNINTSQSSNIKFINNISVINSNKTMDGDTTEWTTFEKVSNYGVFGSTDSTKKSFTSNIVFHNNLAMDYDSTPYTLKTEGISVDYTGVNNNLTQIDPLFLDTTNSDFDLSSTSPAIDAGTSSFMLPDFDVYGNPRVVGNAIDLGAIETSVGAVGLQYTLSVVGGTGSGSFAENTEVMIEAAQPAEGMVFDKWIGDTQCLADKYGKIGWVTTPYQNITITAQYILAP